MSKLNTATYEDNKRNYDSVVAAIKQLQDLVDATDNAFVDLAVRGAISDLAFMRNTLEKLLLRD